MRFFGSPVLGVWVRLIDRTLQVRSKSCFVKFFRLLGDTGLWRNSRNGKPRWRLHLAKTANPLLELARPLLALKRAQHLPHPRRRHARHLGLAVVDAVRKQHRLLLTRPQACEEG